MKIVKLLDQKSLYSRILLTILTTIATFTALVSAFYPVVKDIMQKEIQFELIRYERALDDYDKSNELLNRIAGNLRLAVIQKPLYLLLKEEGYFDKDSVNNYASKIFEKEIQQKLAKIALEPSGVVFEGRHLDSLSQTILEDIQIQYGLIIAQCEYSKDNAISVHEYLNQPENGFNAEDVYQQIKDMAPTLEVSEQLVSKFKNVKQGKECFDGYTDINSKIFMLQRYLKHYIDGFSRR